MAKIKKIVVNNKTYQVQTLGVLDSLYLQAELVHAIGPSVGDLVELYSKAKGNIDNIDAGEFGTSIAKIDPKIVKEIQPKILSQVITPDNRFLGDEQTIEDWFTRPENSGDVWEVIIKGAMVLLGEYLPNFLKGNRQKVTTEATAE